MRSINNQRVGLAVILGALVTVATLHAGTGDGSAPTVKIPPHPTVDPTWAAEIDAAEQSPILPADTLSPHFPGSFFSAQSPWLPPAPGNILGISYWSLGNNLFVLNDVGVDYEALAPVPKPEMVSDKSGGIHMNLSSQTNMPYLTVAAAGTNGILVTVINNAPPVKYEIWTTPVLVNANWTLATNGFTGQTNFLVNINGPFPNGFFQAIWDTNGIPAWEMANPNNPSLGVLAVFIDSPTNGMVIQ
jgi:hypothetical protein